jgi:hypothetical protein
MKDNYDKLSGFIRKKLEQSDRTNDRWDQPDIAVWENAQAQLAATPNHRKRRAPFWFFILFLLILLFGSLFFNWHLLQTNNEVQQQVQQQSEIIADLQKQQLQDQEQQQLQEEKNITSIHQLRSENERIVNQHQEVIRQLKRELRSAEQLIRLQEVMLKSAPLLELQENRSATDLAPVTTENSLQTPLREVPRLPIPFVQAIQKYPSSFANVNIQAASPIKEANNFEIGLHLGQSFLTVPIIYALEKEREPFEQKAKNRANALSYHLQLAYSPKRNWWVKTGLRYSRYSLLSNFRFNTKYDKSAEFFTPNGSLANEFFIEKTASGIRTFRSIEIEVDVEGDMETGDLIFGELEERQEITAWQIPIELEYRQRNYRLGWQVGAGLVANLMRFKEANVSGKVKATQVEFPTVVREKEGEPGSTLKPLFGVQAGAGLHYHLSRQLSLRADAVFQYNRHLTNQHFQLGLAYQF